MDRSDLLLQLFREFAIVDDAARRRLRAALPPALTEAQYGVLNHLHFTSNRDETPGDLARLFDVSPPAMTQLLGRLRGAGLVELLPAPGDGRQRRVRLTAAGRACHEQVAGALGAEFEQLGERLRAQELEALLRQARRFRLALEQSLAALTRSTGP